MTRIVVKASNEPDHDRLKEMLYKLGILKGRIPEKDLRIHGKEIDVVWTETRVKPPRTFNVFVIQFVGDLFASFEKLTYAYREREHPQLVLVTSHKRKEEAVSLTETNIFCEIQNEVKIIDVEEVEQWYKLANSYYSFEAEKIGIKCGLHPYD